MWTLISGPAQCFVAFFEQIVNKVINQTGEAGEAREVERTKQREWNERAMVKERLPKITG